ncbi:MAG: ParB/RepB/Spo0J family partition protein [Lachnospira sp.]|nr:ParB/RepB/Spo0J family partition protein [Lachnospira sp.]
MAVKKSGLGKGLGKGLNTLIPENIEAAPKQKVEKVVVKEPGEVKLKISKIEPNREQPRKVFDEDALMELSESIKQYGLIQPIVVKKRDDYYEIVAGERRWRASKMAGLKEVPVVIKDYTEQEIVEIALIENIQREDLNPVEEALAYERLMKEFKLKQDQIAEKVSKSRVAISNSLRLLKLDKRVQEMLVDDMISSGHARALLSFEDGDLQYETAQKILDQKLSVRETEALVKKLLKGAPKAKELPKNDFVYRDYEEKLKQLLSTKVSINNKANGKGKIEIEYYSMEDFERIVEFLER